MNDVVADAYRRAERLGLIVDEFVVDGQWHRVPVVGKKKHNLAGAYCLSELTLGSGEAVLVGSLWNWVDGSEDLLTLDSRDDVSAEDIVEAKRRAAEAAKKSKQARAELQRETADRAVGIWRKLPDTGRSGYLKAKGVRAWGLRFSRGSVVVPARDVDGKIWTLQFIDAEGEKRFLTGGAKRGRFHMVGELDREQPRLIGIAEGYATAATVHEAIGWSVAVAFDAGNLAPVAEAIHKRYPDALIVLCADDDRHGDYPQAFIRQSEATPQVFSLIARLRAVRPDIPIEVVADDDPRLKAGQSHNIGIAKALLAAALVDGDVIVPHFREAVA